MSAESKERPPAAPAVQIRLSPELQSALTSLHETTARAAEAAQPLLAMAAHAAASLAPLQGVLQEIASAMRPVLESGWLEAFQRQMQSIAPTLVALEKATHVIDAAMRNAEIMGQMGWTFPMNASLHECVELLLVASEGPEATDAAFGAFYAENEKESLLLLLADLRQHPRLAEFGAVLEEVAFGLDHEKYRLVVTALVPMFEGVARRCWVDGFWQGAARAKFFAEKLNTSAPESFDRIVWSATRAFVERLYEKNFHGDPKPLFLNRHWILHGRGPADASSVDALRLLQAIHTVVSLADEEARDARQATEVE